MADNRTLLFCNIGWMARYVGLEGTTDEIIGGGSHVDIYNHGHEVCNFLACPDGQVYGHVETSRSDTVDREIAIERLGASRDDESVGDVTVIWTATNPEASGRYIVGWYENARVYRERQRFRPPTRQHRRDEIDNFRIVTEASNAVLLASEHRILSLGHGSGWMGRAQWWYAQEKARKYKAVASFLDDVNELMDAVPGIYSELAGSSGEGQEAGTREALVQARIGQFQFRKNLLKEWKNCSVTGCSTRRVLRASHIKPWKSSDNQERLDTENGLLLAAGLDAAFDKGLISFMNDGKMIVSQCLSRKDRKALGITLRQRLRKSPNKRRQRYLEYHRSHIFIPE